MQTIQLQRWKTGHKNLLELVLPLFSPLLKRFLLLPCGSVVSRSSFQYRSKWAMFVCSVAMGNIFFFSCLILASLWDLFHLKACLPLQHWHCLPCQLLGFAQWQENIKLSAFLRMYVWIIISKMYWPSEVGSLIYVLDGIATLSRSPYKNIMLHPCMRAFCYWYIFNVIMNVESCPWLKMRSRGKTHVNLHTVWRCYLYSTN